MTLLLVFDQQSLRNSHFFSDMSSIMARYKELVYEQKNFSHVSKWLKIRYQNVKQDIIQIENMLMAFGATVAGLQQSQEKLETGNRAWWLSAQSASTSQRKFPSAQVGVGLERFWTTSQWIFLYFSSGLNLIFVLSWKGQEGAGKFSIEISYYGQFMQKLLLPMSF